MARGVVAPLGVVGPQQPFLIVFTLDTHSLLVFETCSLMTSAAIKQHYLSGALNRWEAN